MKMLPSFPSRSNEHLLQGQFHHMVGTNLFTESTICLNVQKKVLTVSGRWAVNKEIKLNLHDLAEIREGLQTDEWIELKHRLDILKDPTHRPTSVYHFSLVSKSTPEIIPGTTVDLASRDEEKYSEWMEKVRELLAECEEAEERLNNDQLTMLKHFYEKQIKSSMMISYFKLRKFVEKMDINVGGESLDEIMSKHGLSNLHQVTEAQFIKLMEQFDTRTGLDFVFYKYSIANSEFMNAQGLKRFFEEAQNSPKTLAQCEQLIASYSAFNTATSSTTSASSTYLTRRAFYRLFDTLPEFHLFDRRHRAVCQDMNQPLTHYFIASSHNSYLVGNQLTSASSYEMYRRILLDGCRCIEIDVWDGSEEPEVYHGHTLTSRILLRGVLEIVAEFAFTASPYPVILSIENHLNQANQRKMAAMMRSILAPYIYLDDVPAEQKAFPSPQHFRRRIFIKGSKSETFQLPASEATKHRWLCFEWTIPAAPKRKKPGFSKQQSFIYRDFDSDDDDIESSDEEDEQGEDGLDRVGTGTIARRRRINLRSLSNMRVRTRRSYNLREAFRRQQLVTSGTKEGEGLPGEKEGTKAEEEEEDEDPDGLALKTMQREIDIDFSSVINYFKTKKFTNINAAIKEFKFYEMCSRDENASKRIFTANDQQYRQFTATNMVRIYPHGLRTNSTNYMPLDHWDVGAQMVALNYQTVSVAMLINEAQFALNGKSGYVLKPSFLRQPGVVPLPKELPKTMLQVTILCGQFWMQFEAKKIELKVSTRVFCPDKEKRMDLKMPESTRVIEDNGFNPVWNETFVFDLSNPELSFVQFNLVNCKTFVGHHMISFQAMQPGYRHIELYDRQNKRIPFARLYLHIDHWLEEENDEAQKAGN